MRQLLREARMLLNTVDLPVEHARFARALLVRARAFSGKDAEEDEMLRILEKRLMIKEPKGEY